MFESKDEVKGMVDGLVAMAAGYDRGHCIEWEKIEAVTGPRDAERSKYVIGKWRRRLEVERMIVTLVAPGVGVRLLTHRETAAEIPAIRQKRAYRQIRRAIKQVATVDEGRLTTHERRLLSSQKASMAEHRRGLYRSRKNLASGRVTEVSPRRRSDS